MRNLLSFGVALAAIVSAGPLMAQSCCSGGASAPNFSRSTDQPIQNYSGASYAGANYSAPAAYSPSFVNAPTYSPTAYRAPVVYPQQSFAAPVARRISSTYSAPINTTYSSAPSSSFNTASSAPIYSYAAPPAIPRSAKSSGCSGCGCGCGKSGSCGCGS